MLTCERNGRPSGGKKQTTEFF